MSRTEFGPDEISEFAEMLWDACARSPVPVDAPPAGGVPSCCPLYAAFECMVPLQIGDSGAFMRGFDGCSLASHFRKKSERALYELGKRFREQALSGEGFR